MATKRTKRGTIKQLVNRDKSYLVSDIVRKTSKIMGRAYRTCDITSSLKKMQREHQLYHEIRGNRVFAVVLER